MKYIFKIFAMVSLAAGLVTPALSDEMSARAGVADQVKSGNLATSKATLDKQEIAKQLSNATVTFVFPK